MKKPVSLLVALALCGTTLLGVSSYPVQAQDLGGALDLPMLGQSLTMSAAIRAQAQRDAARLRKNGRRPKSQGRPVLKGSTRFRPSAALRQRHLAQFVARVRQVDPVTAASLQKSFAKGDPIAAIAPGLLRYNLRTDDVADATTAYLVSAWYGVRGRNDDPPRSSVNGVRQQMRSVLLSVPAFVSASNASKQQMAEALLVQAMLTDALITASKGSSAQRAKAKLLIAQGAVTSFHLDLNKLKLTSQGLHT